MTADASPNIGLDHVGVFGHDLASLSHLYERLGFQLTPASQHARPASADEPAGLRGTANRCAMLQRGYIELLAVVDPSLDTLGVPEALSRYAGLHIIAFDVEDANATERQLTNAGMPFTRTYLERDVTTPTGSGRAKFTQIKPEARCFPEGRIFMLRHETRELVWQPQYLAHPNTAQKLKDVLVAVNDLAEATNRFERYFGHTPFKADGFSRFSLADGTVFTLAQAGALATRFPGLDLPVTPMPVGMIIEVACVDTAQKVMQDNGVSSAREGDTLLVDAETSGGVLIVFEQIGHEPPPNTHL